MTRRWTASLVALACAVGSPSAHAQAPVAGETAADASVAAENEGHRLADTGDFLGAAEQLATALRLAPADPASRVRRSALATEAVTAYKYAFEADKARCAEARAGLELADKYLAGLRTDHGDAVIAADEYSGLMTSRDALAQASEGCAAPVAEAPKPVTEAPKPVTEAPKPAAPASHAKAFGVGVGVSAALTIGMAVGAGVTYANLRKPGGKLYEAIYDAAASNDVATDEGTDMCKAGADVAAVAAACADWDRGKTTMIAMTALAGVFAVGTAVFTGLLIRDRKHRGPAAQAWLRHGVQIGAAPRVGGGMIAAGLRF